MSSEKDERSPSFELAVSLLLGITACATAFASYQGSLWGGTCLEAFGDAATQTTRASHADHFATVQLSHDFTIDLEAKKFIVEGINTSENDHKRWLLHLASHMLTDQLSELAYTELRLPTEYRSKPGDLPEEVLKQVPDRPLSSTYADHLFEEASRDFAAAEGKFAEGRHANAIGDKFLLVTVIYAVSFFFSGFAATLRSRMRWSVFFTAAAVLIAGTIYLVQLPWL